MTDALERVLAITDGLVAETLLAYVEGETEDARAELMVSASKRAARAILSALREREPVAWRWRENYADGTVGGWTYEAVPVQKRFYHGASVTMEVQALYAAPTLEHQEEQS